VREYLSPAWRNWSASTLEHEYSPSEWAKRSYLECVPDFLEAGEKAKAILGSNLHTDHYGSTARNIVAWSPPTSRDAIFAWIHGGYWQDSSIDEAFLGAGDLAIREFGFAAIEYNLAPEASIPEMIDDCIAALLWLRGHNPGTRIILGGHSAGAHLALAVANRIEVDGLVLVSGIFDLRPLVSTSINGPLALDDERALKLSPIFTESTFSYDVEVLVGGDESPSFQAQAKAAFDYLVDSGASVNLVTKEGLDHFDIILTGEHVSSFLRLADR